MVAGTLSAITQLLAMMLVYVFLGWLLVLYALAASFWRDFTDRPAGR